MKKLCMIPALMLTLGTFAAEALPVADEVWRGGGWNNWTELVAKADAGKIDLTKSGWVIELARYQTDTMSARELWTLIQAESDVVRYSEIGFRILLKNDDAEVVAEIRAVLDAAANGNDEEAAKVARGAYARYYHKKGDYAAAWSYFVKSAAYQDNAVQAGQRLLKSDKANAETVYRGIVSIFDEGAQTSAARPMLSLMLKAAVVAKSDSAEVRTELEQILRLYSPRAVGNTDAAKTWGIFIGEVRESINAWQ